MSRPSSGHVTRITWFTAACLLISNIIGGGIFTVTGYLARDLGDPGLILTLWCVGAAIALAGALSYSELGATFPAAGGDYVYLRHAYGPLMGFLSGWVSFTVGFGCAIAASAVSFATYALRMIPGSQDSHANSFLALVLVWTLTGLHARGVSTGGWAQRILTTTKVMVLLLLIVGGLTAGAGNWSHLSIRPSGPAPSGGMVGVALIFIFYTYLGWNIVGYIAGEIAYAARDIPTIIIGGTGFVAVLYLLINLVYFYALPVTTMGEPPILPVAEKAAAALWGADSARFMNGLLCISIAGGVSAMVWAGPRIYWAMAEDGVFSPFFSRLDPTTGAPVRAIVLQSIWASVLIISGTFEQLVVFGGSVLALFTGMTVAALFILRRRYPEFARPYRVPLYPVVPGLFVICMAGLIIMSATQRPSEALMGLCTVVSGMIFYWCFFKKTIPV
jgi:APA family basic amino acid/polyamine antiporter